MKPLSLTILFILASCSSLGPQTNSKAQEVKEETPSVSVDSALEHIQQSYTLGCVEALRSVGKKNIYPQCREKALRHKAAVRQVLDSPIDIIKP
ncbi:MAG: hypothetical protein K2P81_13200 [Bacteriovoracaceae bacterium]|nr:hypothetical protein [Bacteriovoracaceae bacterium]